MLSRHCPVLYDFPFHHSAALDLTSSVFGFFYGPSFHFLSSPADQARMPKNNVTKRIIPTPIRCITANITSIILFSPFFPMILYNMLFWFFLLLYHVLLKCYNCLINSFYLKEAFLCSIIKNMSLMKHFYCTKNFFPFQTIPFLFSCPKE